MTLPNTSLVKQDLFSHASQQALDRELFYCKLISILLAHVTPEDLQSACAAALDESSAKRSYHEA